MKGLYLLLTVTTCFFACKKSSRQLVFADISADYNKADSFRNHNRDSAFFYFSKVATLSSDSLRIAMAYTGMARIQVDAGDYYGAHESALASIKLLNEKELYHRYWISSDYNELGTGSLNLKNYEAAIEYYNKALEFAPDSLHIWIILNNKATVLQKKGDYQSAINFYESIVDKSSADAGEYARVMSNLARTKWLKDSNYRAAPELWKAKKLRESTNDFMGMNASYAHLSDYYASTRPDSAFFYANKMYQVAQQLNSPDDEVEALQKLVKLAPPQSVKKYFDRYQYLNDSVQIVRNSAKNQFALIRYEAEKSKSDNAILQKDNAEKRIQIIKQRIFLFGTIALFLLLSIAATLWYRRRKQQMIRESQNAIRENQLKTSQKVHDVVANGLYRIMTGLEHGDQIVKEQLIDKIDSLYEKSRNISYEGISNNFQDFYETIKELLTSFAGPGVKVLLVGNSKELWLDTSIRVRQEVEPVLQELMVNMKKHSHARNVVIRFERVGQEITIYYADDGVGLSLDFRNGNGLTNTENRIKSIGGQVTFDKSVTKGLKINIYFPTAS